MAMPAARAIRYKSSLAPANALRAFRFYPYCICQHSSNTHCQAAHASPLPKPANKCRCPARWWMRKKGVLKPRAIKNFL